MRSRNRKRHPRNSRAAEIGTIAEILALRAGGKTQTEIANTLGVSQGHVCKVLARTGGAR